MLLCVPIVLAPLGKTFEEEVKEEVKELKLRAAKLKLLLAAVSYTHLTLPTILLV